MKNKINKRIQRKLISNLTEWKSTFIKDIDNCLVEFKQAKTVTEIMDLKRDLLVAILDGFPIGSVHCYYCLKFSQFSFNTNNCENCDYGKAKKICSDDNSIYGEISQQLQNLRDYVVRNYSFRKD